MGDVDETQITPDRERPSAARAPKSPHDILESYVNHVNSLEISLPLAMNAVEDHLLEALKSLKSLFSRLSSWNQGGHISDEAYLESTSKLSLSHSELVDSKRIFMGHAKAQSVLPGAYLVSLLSGFDEFFGSLARHVVGRNPALLRALSISVPAQGLAENMTSMQVLIDYVIGLELDSVLRDSHINQLKWWKTKFKVKVETDSQRWDAKAAFAEVAQRRNCLVHAGGVVGDAYVANCIKSGVPRSAALTKGDVAHVELDYFRKACECVIEVAARLTYAAWFKIFPEEAEAAHSRLFKFCFNFLLQGRFRIAVRLMEFATSDLAKPMPESHKLVYVINQAQCYKWLGDESKMRRLLKSQDWSRASLDYRLAVSVLQDEYDKAANFMRASTPGELKLGMVEYLEWPLFKEFRRTPQFGSAFEERFGVRFALRESLQAVSNALAGASLPQSSSHAFDPKTALAPDAPSPANRSVADAEHRTYAGDDGSIEQC